MIVIIAIKIQHKKRMWQTNFLFCLPNSFVSMWLKLRSLNEFFLRWINYYSESFCFWSCREINRVGSLTMTKNLWIFFWSVWKVWKLFEGLSLFKIGQKFMNRSFSDQFCPNDSTCGRRFGSANKNSKTEFQLHEGIECRNFLTDWHSLWNIIPLVEFIARIERKFFLTLPKVFDWLWCF